MRKELKISKRLANKLRSYNEQERSSLSLIGKNKDDVVSRIFPLPDDGGGCCFEQGVKSSSMTKMLLEVYSKRLIPAGFFYINTFEVFRTDEDYDLPMDEIVDGIYENSIESFNYKFFNTPVIVVCKNKLYARYMKEEYGVWLSLKIKEV